MRSVNFHNLYKQKLMEKIIEKKDRADKVKEQQLRIADACSTVKNGDPFRSIIGNKDKDFKPMSAKNKKGPGLNQSSIF